MSYQPTIQNGGFGPQRPVGVFEYIVLWVLLLLVFGSFFWGLGSIVFDFFL